MTMSRSESATLFYVETAVIGAVRAIAASGLPFEHPFDSLKSRLQADHIRNLKLHEMALETYQKYGVINGFYAGFIPAAVRNMLKQIYRWPLMLYLPAFFNKLSPEKMVEKFKFLPKLQTGFTIACVDAFLVCPLERLKIVLQTRRQELSYREFWKENRAEITATLFRGLEPFFYRNLISWISFLYADFEFKRIYRGIKNIAPDEPLDSSSLLQISVFVGIVNIMTGMPMDMVKTLYQQYAGDYAKLSVSQVIKRVYRESGFKGFYFGWQPRFLQYIIQSVFTVPILDALEVRQKRLHAQYFF